MILRWAVRAAVLGIAVCLAVLGAMGVLVKAGLL